MSRPPKRFKWLKALLRGDSLKARAARSTFWIFGSKFSTQAMRLVSNLILTRLLFPEVFGLMALVQVILTGLALFSDTGIRSSIIRSDRGNDPDFLNTAWTLQVIRGVILWLVACAIGLPVAWFYGEPLLAQLLPVAGLTLIVTGFTPTVIYTSHRDLRLGRQMRISGLAQAIGIVIMVTLAWAMESVWALIIGTILTALLRQALLLVMMPGARNRFCMERTALGELFHFGKWILVSTAFGFLVNHADRLILGKFISFEMLGIYTIAFFMGSVPLMLGRPLASKIIFPLYKQRPPWESVENQQKMFRLRRLLTAGMLGLSAVLAMGGDLLIRGLYDPRYDLAGPMLVLLVVAQLPMVIPIAYAHLLLAAGDSKRFTLYLGAMAIVQTAALLWGVTQFGIVGAILAPGIAAVLVYPLLVSAIRRYRGWDPLHDAVAAAAALLIGAGALWLHWDILADLAARTMP